MQRIGGDERIIHPRAPRDFDFAAHSSTICSMGYDVYSGMRHGRLTVVRELERQNGHQRFECKCDCGNTAILRGSHFYPERRFCTRSCPLLTDHRLDDISGQHFGIWRAIKPVGFRMISGKKRRIWLCECECGTRRELNGEMLTGGTSKSCGCSIASKYTPEERLRTKREISARSARKHAARVRAAKIRYERKLSMATPVWLTKEHWAEMDAIYANARKLTRKTGVRHEVDHIVPLNGKLVSGLHVPWNLQVLTQSENVAKSNRYADLHGDMEK